MSRSSGTDDSTDDVDPADLSATDDEPVVTDDEASSRYVITRGQGEAGYATYERIDRTVVFTHTEIDPTFKGEGLGSVLVGAALDDVRQRGERVVPQCPFVADYIRRHPDYAELLVR